MVGAVEVLWTRMDWELELHEADSEHRVCIIVSNAPYIGYKSYRTVNRYCSPSTGSSLKSSGRFATGRICRPNEGSSSSESSRLRLGGMWILEV